MKKHDAAKASLPTRWGDFCALSAFQFEKLARFQWPILTLRFGIHWIYKTLTAHADYLAVEKPTLGNYWAKSTTWDWWPWSQKTCWHLCWPRLRRAIGNSKFLKTTLGPSSDLANAMRVRLYETLSKRDEKWGQWFLPAFWATLAENETAWLTRRTKF